MCDDGSIDKTAEVISALCEKSEFPVIVISASTHIGKARMDNEAVASANGDFILWNDSDDYLLPKAIETLVDAIGAISESERANYVGIAALCSNKDGELISTPLPFDHVFDTTWNDLVAKYKVKNDMLYMTRSAVLKANPFPEVDFVVPESVVWNAIGNAKARVLPIVVKIVEYGAPNAVSFSGLMEYSRGRAYAMAVMERYLSGYRQSILRRLWVLITYIRYSVHGEIDIFTLRRLWGENSGSIEFAMMMPLAILLAVKDTLQRKVRKTHREFDKANSTVSIRVRKYVGGKIL